MIKFTTLCLLGLLLFPLHSSTTQYLYPVATIDQNVYCIYQSSSEIITMIVWDHEHKEMVPGLLSRYMPAGFHLLANNEGYGFLDAGILRIKKFIKRSPKSLEFYAPIYDINVPGWINAEVGYFSAKVRDTYGIFQFDIDANLVGLLLDAKKDFLYPQKIGDTLFYIERIKRGLGYQFRVMSIGYPQNVVMKNDDDRIAFYPVLSDQYDALEIFDFHEEPIAFLNMQDANTGFLVSYPAHVDEQADYLVCSYYKISKKQNWQEQRLFDFILPTSLLFKSSEEHLFESILPLLPRHIGNDIYFVDASASDNQSLNIFVYHSDNGRTEQLTTLDKPGEHYFAPIQVGPYLYCGGSGYGNELHYLQMIWN